MALFQVDFYSETLSRITTFNIILPNDHSPFISVDKQNNKYYNRETKILFLLHGFTGNRNDWIIGTNIAQLSAKYNIAVVLPSGENNFYIDNKGIGRSYCKYIGYELVSYVRKTFGLSGKRKDTSIAGLSMGGFGSIHIGLSYPDVFSKIVALSSALIINDLKNLDKNSEENAEEYFFHEHIFGDLSKIHISMNNPEMQILHLKNNKKEIPLIYMSCGLEDSLLETNRSFYNFLNQEQVAVNYKEKEGKHDWDFWSSEIEPSIKWLLEE